MYQAVKCKKCRRQLFDEAECSSLFVSAHHVDLKDSTADVNCQSIKEETLLFLNEECLPTWVQIYIQTENWAKGKLNCNHCNAKIGYFDFVSGLKCECNAVVLPAVHVVKSKVDVVKKFKFCGDADCPDWVLAEINNLSKLSSVKLKVLAQLVAKSIITPPINMEKAEKLFNESKLDAKIDLRASIACISHIITSTIRYNCDHNALHSELQQLGLPREHSTSIKRVVDEHSNELLSKLKATSLKVNPLEEVSASYNTNSNCVDLSMTINGETSNVIMTPFTLNVLLENLKQARGTMSELNSAPYIIQ